MSDRARILVVDDAEATLEVLRRQLEDRGHEVWTAAEVTAALKCLDDGPLDLVITDLRMPGPDGLDLVRHVRENRPDLEIMMITGYASIEGAVEAVKTGVAEYLAKPFTEDELHQAVERALASLQRRRGRQFDHQHRLAGPSLEPIRNAIGHAASGLAPVLVVGPPGSGRSLVSRLIHDLGPRDAGPFVALQAELMADGLAAQELLASARNAQGGTLVVDGVEHLPVGAQVPLLRMLNQRCLPTRTGSGTVKADVRTVATSDRSAAELRASEVLRGDLVDRLAATTIVLPPLRRRREDIPTIAAALLARSIRQGDPAPLELTEAAAEALRRSDWPGNVRELAHVLREAAVSAQTGAVDVTDLPERFRFSAETHTGATATLAEVEAAHIRAVLQETGGNKSEAARILGIDRKTLRERLRRMNR
jgi:two-component system response regulator HydG